jgi:tRNA pseudouridine65 synthase
LKTGRQHQIRKPAVLNRHAVLGDTRYGDRRYNAMIKKRYDYTGMTLHAERLQLTVSDEGFDWVVPVPDAWSCFELSFNQP